MTTLTLTYRTVHNRIKALSLPQINWKIVYVCGILLCLLFLIFYIFSINQLTKGAYLFKNYNKEMSSLLKENKAMEADLAATNLLDEINNKARELGFEKILQIKYIEFLDNSLAKSN